MIGTKQQEFVKFLNNIELTRYMQIEQACIACPELAFCVENWSHFMACTWMAPESFFPIMWGIVDNTYGKEAGNE